jgi:hypothetical protein
MKFKLDDDGRELVGLVLNFEFSPPVWLFRLLSGSARADRLEANRRVTGRASESVEFGPFVIQYNRDNPA